jgi:hypothetical protein
VLPGEAAQHVDGLVLDEVVAVREGAHRLTDVLVGEVGPDPVVFVRPCGRTRGGLEFEERPAGITLTVRSLS